MATGKTILVVEDSPDVAEAIRGYLEQEGYVCQHVGDGEAALAAVRRQLPDLILLDRGLPRMTGDEVARNLRSDARTRSVPIIMLTGKAEESDELVGFALGADDYVAKPFSLKVLLARIEVQLRRKEAAEQHYATLPASTVKLDRTQPRVFIDQTPIALTSVEYKILAALMAAGGTVLRSQQLLGLIYGREQPSDDRGLATHVGGLQRKLGPAGACIQVVSGDEYAFCPPRNPAPSA